ncbi:uncharacterized protein GJ701_000361 isoform 2-T2 [Geothlypis trichas]
MRILQLECREGRVCRECRLGSVGAQAILPGAGTPEDEPQGFSHHTRCCPGCLSVLPRRKGSLCLACPAQLDVAGLCGLARQEQLAVLWSALEPSLAGQEQSPNSSHLGQNLGCLSSQAKRPQHQGLPWRALGLPTLGLLPRLQIKSFGASGSFWFFNSHISPLSLRWMLDLPLWTCTELSLQELPGLGGCEFMFFSLGNWN